MSNDRKAVADGDVIIGMTPDVVDEPVFARNVDDFERLSDDV